jgi:hypothetical protein
LDQATHSHLYHPVKLLTLIAAHNNMSVDELLGKKLDGLLIRG